MIVMPEKTDAGDEALEKLAAEVLACVKVIGVDSTVMYLLASATALAKSSGEMEPGRYLELVDGLARNAVKVESAGRRVQ